MLFSKKLYKYISKKGVTWKKSIEIGIEYLVKEGYCTNEIKEKIVECTLKYGPYYIFTPHIALAHAEPGVWCFKEGISFTYFENPVSFSGKIQHKVKALFVLSAIDAQSHINLLKEFAVVIGKENFREKLLKCKSNSEVEKLIFNQI